MTKKVRFNLYLEPELAKNLSDKAEELAARPLRKKKKRHQNVMKYKNIKL